LFRAICANSKVGVTTPSSRFRRPSSRNGKRK
jgi:hypothetical protein